MTRTRSARHVEMLAHDRLERAVGGDDAIGRPRTDEDGASQRQVAGALEPRAPRVGRAELFEALRVEDERRDARRAPPGISEHARAEPVDDVDLAVADELPGQSPGAQAEERVGRAAIDHRRAASAGARERPIGDGPERDPWVDDIRALWRLRRAGDERRLDAGVGEVAHEVVDVPLEAAEAVQREHGSGDDGDAERGFHLEDADVIFDGTRISRILSTGRGFRGSH